MIVQLHTYVEARLGRWRVWYRWGPRPGPRPIISWFGALMDRMTEQLGRRSTTCPVDISEAEETHRAVMSLPPELRATVFEAYLTGGAVDQKRRALGLRSRQSYYDRLNRAYHTLLGYFNDQAAGVSLPAVVPGVPAHLATPWHTRARRKRPPQPGAAPSCSPSSKSA